jgi:hypothetical protein
MQLALIALTLAAAEAPAVDGRDVPLPPGELRGQVMRASGGPMTSFTVNGVRFDDPRGRFKILTPPEGRFRVVVRADGLAPNVFHVPGASGKKLHVPDITLGDGEHFLGEVLDAQTGEPVQDARVSLGDPAQAERLRFVRGERVAPLAVSGPGGWYDLRRVARGLLILVVSHPEYLTEFVPVNTRDGLPTVFLRRGGGISGVVRDARGPLAGASVVALSDDEKDGGEAKVNAAGRFELKGLHPGHYRVIALSQGHATDAGEVTVPDGGVAEVKISVPARPRRAARVARR